METLSVRCNHCGAPLQVAENTRFVTCQFCHSSLEVKRTESSLFTEEVARIAENTGKMAESLEVIQVQNEIERLDREHPHEQKAASQPPGANAVGGCVAMVALTLFTSFGIFFATGSSKMGAPAIFPIFGGGFALIGVIALVAMLARMAGPDKRTSDYQRSRAELTRKLAELTKDV